MATMTSTAATASGSAGTTVTYTITDVVGNIITVVAPPMPGPVTFSGSGLPDAQAMLSQLVLMLQANGTSPRPQVLNNTSGGSTYS